MEFETRVCRNCGTESVIFVDGVYACESCGRIDDTGDAVFESEPLGVSVREQEEGVNTRRQTSEELIGELLEIHRIALQLPERVREEAQATFNEVKVLDVNCTRRFSRKLLSGMLLFISSRKLDFPLTTQEASAVINIKHKYFIRNLRYFAVLSDLEIPRLNLHKLVDRVFDRVKDGVKEHHLEMISANQMEAFIKELHSVIDILQLANLIPSVNRPLILSGTLYIIAMKICGFDVTDELKNVVCEAHGIRQSQLNRAELNFRHELLTQCTRIPGMPLSINIRNALEFFPHFKEYHLQIKTIKEELSNSHGPDSRHKMVDARTRNQQSIDGIAGTAQRIVMKQLHSKIQTQGKVCTERGELDLRSKRKRGFEAFVNDVNTRRRRNGLEDIVSFFGTSEITEQGRTIGYTQSLPLRPQNGTLTEIRRGSLNSGVHKTAPLSFLEPPRPRPAAKERNLKQQVCIELESSSNEEDLNVEEYILQPDEVILRKLLWKE